MRISDWSSDVCSSDLPAEFEHVLLDEPKHLADPRPGRPCKFGSLQFLACCKENAVIGTKTQRLDQFRGFLLAVVLSDRAAGHAVLDIDIAKTRMTFATGPDIHVIEEFAATSPRARPGNRTDDAAVFQIRNA